MTRQVKSKQRVADHGEVFTAEREVNAMLDLVKQETERIDSRFLEPACGDGNFLSEILRRKMTVVKRKYRRSPIDYEKNAVLAACSIYGVDILMDNVIACRERMFKIWNKEYTSVCKKEANDDCREAVKFILSRNILCGNALTMKCVDEHGNDTDEPIVFSEWAFIMGMNIQRSDYRFDKLLAGDYDAKALEEKKAEKVEENFYQLNLQMFSAEKPEQEAEFIKKTISNYRRVQDNG